MTVRIGRGSSAILLFLLAAVGGAHVGGFACSPECLCTGMAIACRDKTLLNVPAFENINGANIVDLSGNQIEMIECEELNWKGIEQLQYLYFNVNSIVYVNEEAFEVFRNLEYLDLSNNLLEFLPSRMFESNRRLATLKLAGNQFGRNPPSFVSESITELDLSFCKLDAFGAKQLSGLSRLRRLNLQANNFLYINPGSFNAIVNVKLSYNPWACNCSTVELYRWAKASDHRIGIDDPIQCRLKNHIFIDLFKKAQLHLQKESCFIDSESFEPPSIKEGSLVLSNSTEARGKSAPAASNNRITILSTCLIIAGIACLTFAIIRFLLKRSNSHQHQLSEHLLTELQ